VLSIRDTLFVGDLFVAIHELPPQTQILASASNRLPTGIWGLASDLVSTLRFLHRAEYVHGALSPWTIYISDERASISELWWMHTAEGDPLCSASSEQITGTIPAEYRSFMAPEQLLGEPPSRDSDLYSLGAILYFALTGDFPKHIVQSVTSNELVDHESHQIQLAEILNSRADATMASLIKQLLLNQDERINIFMLEAIIRQRMEAGTRS
jgi:serine/threonine protein kinase